jgi:hypothetical protein
MSLASADADEAAELRPVHDRVEVLAASYKQAAERGTGGTVDTGAFAAALVDEISEISDERISLLVDEQEREPARLLSLREAVALGLLLHELLQSFRPTLDEQRSRIEHRGTVVQIDPSSAGWRLVLSGVPERQAGALECTMIDALADQTRASVSHSISPDGRLYWIVRL